MMLTKYESYQESGVDWLGNIPEDWDVKRIKDVIVKIGSGVTPKGGSEIYPITGIPFLRSQNVYDEGLELDNVAFITEEINEKMKSSQIKLNDILLNITGASIGRTCIVPDYLKKANINQHISFIRLKNKMNIDFFSLYLKSHFLKEYISSQQNGASKEAFNLAQIAIIPILDFDNNYSRLISNFLDQKTSQIVRKIKLLQEKKESYEELKKSLINETVCRGIIKNVELQESDIEWIGKIPKHWKVDRGKDKFFYEKRINKGLICKNVLSLTYDGVINKDFNTNAGLNPGSYETYQFVNKEDLIFKLIDLENIKTSRVGIVHEHGIMSSAYIKLKPKKNIFSRYYYYLYFFYYRINLFNFLGGGVRSTLNYSSLLEIPIISPLFIEEQIQIANYLDEKTSKIDIIISKINAQVETLKEFRKTLINDVVTGKVRIQDE